MFTTRLCRLEDMLFNQINLSGLPLPVAQHPFHPTRRWRFDFAWPGQLVAVEVEGGVWTNGRHVRGAGFEADCQKYNEAAIMGWRVLRVTGGMIHSGEALRYIELAVGKAKDE